MDDPTRKIRLLAEGLGTPSLKTHMAAAGLLSASDVLREANAAKSLLSQAGLPRSILDMQAAAQGLDGSSFAASKALREAFSGYTAAAHASRALGSVHASIAQMAHAVYGPLGDMKRMTLYNQELFESFRLRQQAIDSFGIIHPDFSQVSQIAKTIAGIIRPHEQAFAQLDGWKRDLADRMGRISSAWALADDLEFSGMAFGELTRLGSTIRYDAPFSEATDEYVIDELGQLVTVDDDADEEAREIAYSEAGRNPDLIAFPRPVYGGVLIAAGFTFDVPAAPAPVAIANGDDSAKFDPEFYAALTHLEQHLRQFVQSRLAALDSAWLRRRVPGDMLRDWKLRQSEDEAAGRPVYEPIQYANFMDLADIICARNNWNETFQAAFQKSDALRVSLMRLHPMRNNTAHSRPRTQTDMLYFTTEAHRLLRAMGVIRN